MRLRLLMMLTAFALLTLPSAAVAGGFASVGLSSTPEGTAPGKPWKVDLTILQHGRTPLDGVSPKIHISNDDGVTKTFPATAVPGKSGVYRAEVVFPTAGKWNYEVEDGFSLRHTYAPVEISDDAAAPAAPASVPARDTAPPVAAGDGRPWVTALLAAAGAGLLVALLSALAIRRRRRPATGGTLAPAS